MGVVPGWIALLLAVLGVAVGVFGSQATLGKQVTRALTLLEGVDGRLEAVDARIAKLEKQPPTVVHYHRRKSDAEDAGES